MNRTRVKICGITNPEDANLAAQLGADAIGMIFYAKSLRYISVQQAAAIVATLPPFVSRVGVFVNAKVEEIKQVLSIVQLDYLQFHGEETAAYCQQFGLSYIKSIAMQANVDVKKIAKQYPNATAFLLDSYHAGKKGGTGETFDWQAAQVNLGKPLILAGGLNADNVETAIRMVKPYAVDITSGIEEKPGKKSPEKLQKFFVSVKV